MLSLLLVAVLLLPAIPARASAVPQTHVQIQDQIRAVYREALRRSGKSSFEGFCGAFVTWQAYIMGIDSQRRKLDGNMLYNSYRLQDYTDTGYKVQPFSGGFWTLESALLALTQSGSIDVYNVIVGFDETASESGKLYGHGVYIHAIKDGMVHFAESYPIYINGIWVPEGYPIMVTIRQFCDYYSPDRGMVFDGLINFGNLPYTTGCTAITGEPKNAVIIRDTALWSEPCTSEVDFRSDVLLQLQAGVGAVTGGGYENTCGELWYQVEVDGALGYVPAEAVRQTEESRPFGTDGWLEWQDMRFFFRDGQPISGWAFIEGMRCYFNENGVLQTGWVNIEGTRRYIMPSGALRSGWHEIDGAVYYLKNNVAPHVGWQELEGSTYYFNEKGAMTTGNAVIDGIAYCFSEDGKLLRCRTAETVADSDARSDAKQTRGMVTLLP